VTATGIQTIAGLTNRSSLNVTGNVFASNAVTTTNVFTTNVTATGIQTIAGLAGLTSLNVTGNVFASNAVTTTNVFTTNVYLASGLTAATPPATKGAFEFNGTGGVFYTTPQLVRGISPSHHFYMQNADVTYGTTLSGTASAMFPAVTTGITLQPGKYYLRSSHIITVTSAAPGSTTMSTVYAGGATYTIFIMSQNITSTTAPGTLIQSAAINLMYNSVKTATVISTTLTNGSPTSLYTTLEGFIDVSVAGTFLPQIAFTSAGGTPLSAATPGVRNGSFMYLEPLGPSATIVNVGGWA
jgi:hypothetical protein